jgi:hypothetical protein
MKKMLTKSLYLHVADSEVWGVTDDNPQDVKCLCETGSVPNEVFDYESVYIIGTAEAANLIVTLHDMKERHGTPSSVKVGTKVVTTKKPGKNALRLIDSIRDLAAPSLGGWRETSDSNTASYQLIQKTSHNGWSVVEVKKWCEANHPAWDAISFLEAEALVSVVHVLKKIVDPLWYVDSDKPQRKSKLYSYLGLSPGHIRAELVSRYSSNTTAGFVMDACRHGYSFSDTEPHDFIHQFKKRYPDPVKATLRATQLYIDFVCGVWVDRMSSDELFVPEYFFANKVEWPKEVAGAFTHHCENR